MAFFFQELVNGITTGALYALVALGFTMVYGVLKLLNFAHGDLYMVGAYIGFFVIQWFGGPSHLTIAVPLLLVILFVLAAGLVGGLGGAIQRFADREAAEMLSINVNFTIAATFFIGSALAGIAGVMGGLLFNQVTATIGFIAGLKAFTAAVVGGIGSIPGAMLGGLLLGVAESFITGYISSTYTNLFVFALLIAVMLVRPTGLLGRAQLQKV